MTEVVTAGERCANCDAGLHGEFCSACGQRARDLHQPVGRLVSEFVEDVLSLDARLTKTIRPLLLTPGMLVREYLAGRRTRYLPPLKTYLTAAFIFFSLFTVFPPNARYAVFVEGSPEQEAARNNPGSQVSFALPAHAPAPLDRRYQAALARAKANPERFANAALANIPRVFFLLLPMFALLLELFYRKQGYYIDHLIFALYYHAFVFLTFAAVFLVGKTAGWTPGVVRFAINAVLQVWLAAYLPIALRRVYGGSWAKTLLKLTGLGVLYVPVVLTGLFVLTVMAIATF